MTAAAPSSLSDLGAAIRTWAPVAVLVFGGLGAWFNLSAKVERIEEKHAIWRQQQTEATAKITAAIEREQTDTRTLMIELARLATTSEAIREELRRQAQRPDRRSENQGLSPAAREVP